MIRNSIVAKMWLTIVVMVVIVLTLLGVLLQQFLDNYVYEQQAGEMTRLAQSVHHLIQHNDLALAENVAQQLATVQHAQIVIKVPFGSDQSMVRTFDSLSNEQRQTFLSGNPVVVRGRSQGTDIISVYMMIPTGGAPGMEIVSQQMSVLHEPLARMRNLILFAMVLGVLLTTGFAFVISKNLSRPLVQMHRVAEEMAKGHFDGKIEVVTNDEVGRLGRTFNALVNKLDKTIAALSMEKEQLSSILSSLQDGVIAVDLAGQITLANPPVIRRLQALTLEETGVPDAAHLPERLRRIMESAMHGRETVLREMHWQGRYLVVTATPLYESDGETIRGAVAVVRDVTEERRLDRLRKDFIANVSHELRTPLSMMQGYAEALLDEFGDDPQQRRELTGIIHDEALRMKRLVNDLLDLAQLESGQFQMSFQELDITEIVRRTVRKFAALVQERGISLVSHVPDEPVRVWGDGDRMEQVLTNLLDNALRHTSEGGTVGIHLTASARHAQIRVSDTGTGIPEEDIPYIWERFYKADKARTRGTSGTGLGLAITRHIVVEHRGDIVVQSELGKGTTFIVSIPLLSVTGS